MLPVYPAWYRNIKVRMYSAACCLRKQVKFRVGRHLHFNSAAKCIQIIDPTGIEYPCYPYTAANGVSLYRFNNRMAVDPDTSTDCFCGYRSQYFICRYFPWNGFNARITRDTFKVDRTADTLASYIISGTYYLYTSAYCVYFYTITNTFIS